MSWLDDILVQLREPDAWAYRAGDPVAAEPTALAALALLGHGRLRDATAALHRLCEAQSPSGALAIYEGQTSPTWPTACAALAWLAAMRDLAKDDPERDRYRAAVVRAGEFLLSIPCSVFPRRDPNDPQADEIGHDSMLEGWPWVAGTHPWMEPTALAFLALKASGRRAHPRVDQAQRMLVDRLLPSGGCNHGNTFVLGQVLVPHVQPTGIVMLALAGEADRNDRVLRSLAYLERSVDTTTAAASLAYALMGLAAHKRRPANAEELLAAAAEKPTVGLGANLPRRALLALAALGERSPLVLLAREGVPT